MKKIVFILLSLFLVLLVNMSFAGEATLFGPKELTINSWHFHVSSHRFTVDDPGEGLLTVTKNTPDKNIRGGFIIFNGKKIRLRSFLRGSDTVFEKTISLKSQNRMTIFLRGTPGASVTIEVKKKGFIPPPAVIFSAEPSTITSEESSTLAWSTTDADSVSIDQGIGDVSLSGSTVVSPAETTTYTITVAGDGGTATADVTVTVISPITLEITSPSEGAAISRSDIVVQGTIINTSGNETGVVANGVVAIVYGSKFVANHVPLQEGENIITAAATDAQGNTASVSITVNAETTGDYIRLTADTESGVFPLETALKVNGSFSFTESSLTYTGPGVVEYLENVNENEYTVKITTPGIYYFTAEVEGAENNIYTDTIAIEVIDEAQLDPLLRTKWDGMKAALVNRDIQNALDYFTEHKKGLYGEIYAALYDNLPKIVQDMQDIELIYAEDNLAKYCVRKDELYGGEIMTITYYIYFTKDKKGLWKIYRY